MIKLFDTRVKDDNSPCPINAGDFIRFRLISGYENIAYVVDVTYEENNNDPYDDATLEVLFPTNLNYGSERNKPGRKIIRYKEIEEYNEISQIEFNEAREEYMKNYASEHREHLNALKRESARRIRENESGDEMVERKMKKKEYDEKNQRYTNIKRAIHNREEKGEDTRDLRAMLIKEAKKIGVNPKK